MIRINFELTLQYRIESPGADFLFKIQAAHTRNQVVASERLSLSQDLESEAFTEPLTGTRCIRLHAFPGDLTVAYTATVDLDHRRDPPMQLTEVPIRRLPPDVIGYLNPSRYCESDRLFNLANATFGALPQGYVRAQAICDWVRGHVRFTPNTSNATTSAIDTLVDRVGVCRDFAHLMIALCRAVNLPARFVTGSDYGADPALGPPDFHAYVEVYLSGGWYIFDPSGLAIPMGLVRISTGRDAADAAFATIVGRFSSYAPLIHAAAVVDPTQGMEDPHHCADAISTDARPV